MSAIVEQLDLIIKFISENQEWIKIKRIFGYMVFVGQNNIGIMTNDKFKFKDINGNYFENDVEECKKAILSWKEKVE